LRDGGGDAHLVGGERLLLGTGDADVHRQVHRARRALGSEQHAPGKSVFDDDAIGIDEAFARHLGDLATMDDREAVAGMARLVDGEQPVARPSHDLRAMGAQASRQVLPGIGLGRLEQAVRGYCGSGGVLAARAEGIGKLGDGAAGDGNGNSQQPRKAAWAHPPKSVGTPQLTPSSA